MSNTPAMHALAREPRPTAPKPDRRALRAALRELEDAAYLMGKDADDADASARYLAARETTYALLGILRD